MTADYDLIVIGGGAGGLGAVRAAARRKARTLLVQHGPLGDDCTFTGCVPSKALIEAAARGEPFEQALAAAHHAVATIAATESDAIIEGEGIEVWHGWASFRSPTRLEVDGAAVSGSRFVIATGAGPAVPPIPGLADLDYLTNETVFDLGERPARLVVLGGGAIGCELAQAFQRLGCQVTLTEGLDRLLVKDEPEASATIADAFTDAGMTIRLTEPVVRVEALERKGAAIVHLGDGSTVEADRVLVAVGRSPFTDGLGLDAAGFRTEKGFISTDARLATNVSGIWAVGDLAGKLQFTHAADQMGRIAAGNALGRIKRRFDESAIPWVTFTRPEVRRVGMTEAEAADHGGRVAYLPMTEVDRAVVAGETRGFIKLVAGPRHVLRRVGGGRILGATVVASRGASSSTRWRWPSRPTCSPDGWPKRCMRTPPGQPPSRKPPPSSSPRSRVEPHTRPADRKEPRVSRPDDELPLPPGAEHHPPKLRRAGATVASHFDGAEPRRLEATAAQVACAQQVDPEFVARRSSA